MKKSKFAVIGAGKFGSAIARELASKGAEVHVFDNCEERIENIKDEVALAVMLDATDVRALQSQSVNDVDVGIVAIGENFEAVILSTVHLIDMGVERVISRASGPHQKTILEKIGVNEILTPEDEVASVLVERVLNPDIVSFLQFPDDYEIAEIKAPKAICNRSIDEIDLRNKYKLTLVTIKRESEVKKGGELVKEQHMLGVPKSETVIEETDTIVVFGTLKDIDRFIEINH